MSVNGVFPNIYLNSVLPTVPIEKDIFLIMAARSRFSSGFLITLENHYKNIYSTIHRGEYREESYLIDIDMDYVNRSIDYLCRHELLEASSSASDLFELTLRGESFVRFVTENVYRDHCQNEVRQSGKAKHPVFWDLAIQYPDYDPTD